MKKLTNKIRVFKVNADGNCFITYIPYHISAVKNLFAGPVDTIKLFNRSLCLTAYIRRFDRNAHLEPNKKVHGVYGDIVITNGLNGVLKDLSDEQYKFLINVFSKRKKV